MFVVEGLRLLETQQYFFAKGRTTKGPRVTNANGVDKLSMHQIQPDGFAHAIDGAFVGPEPFAEEHNWTLYGVLASDNGCVWGGNFRSLPADMTHIELTKGQVTQWAVLHQPGGSGAPLNT